MLCLTLFKYRNKKNKIVIRIPPSDKEQVIEIYANQSRANVGIIAPKEVDIGRRNVEQT